MDKNYWEKVSPNYKHEIFSVLKEDQKGVIKSAIRKLASKNKTIGDIGCGIGFWLPLLSSLYKKVYALDLSKGNVEQAKKTYGKLGNIEFSSDDIAKKKLSVKFDTILCVNVAITPYKKILDKIFKALKDHLKPGGHLVLIVPSLESSLYSSYIFNEWTFGRSSKSIRAKQALELVKNGAVVIDGESTKHYLKEELMFIMKKLNFEIQKIEKVEYSWNTEFPNLPKHLQVANPWDWMVVAQKK